MPLLKVVVAFSKTEVEFTCLTLILGFLRAVFNNTAVITVSFIGHYYQLVVCSYIRFVVPPLLKGGIIYSSSSDEAALDHAPPM